MAIAQLCNGILTGLKADTKPTTGYPNGYKFIETDSGNEFKLVNGEWLRREIAEYFDAGVRVGGYLGSGGSITPTDGVWDGLVLANNTGSGTFNAAVIESTGVCARFQTVTTNNSLVGHRVGTYTERDLNPWILGKFRLNTITGTRFFLGWRSSGAAMASAADPLANLSGVGFWFDTAVHATNIAVIQNSGGATSDVTTIANIGTMVATSRFTYEIRAVEASSKFQVRFNGFPNGAWTDVNTAIPAATTDLGAGWYQECTDSINKNFDIYHVKTKLDLPA